MSIEFSTQDSIAPLIFSHRQPLDSLLKRMIELKVSDLHLNRTECGLELYTRVHGKFNFIGALPSEETLSLVAQLKLHAQLDISQTQLPQDGKLRVETSFHPVYIRVSTLPTAYGEDFVLRFFEDKPPQDSLEALGFSPEASGMLGQMLQKKSGLILVTGSTGSGKTTTLYTCLQMLRKAQLRNIVTLEDPIEVHLKGVRQSQVNAEIGYGFAEGLRAILRQDPDVIMIGEIRDREAARTALEAAYTGHLVLSTLHTKDCASTIMRLQTFELDPFWIQQSLIGIVSQRLVPAEGVGSQTLLTEIQVNP